MYQRLLSLLLVVVSLRTLMFSATQSDYHQHLDSDQCRTVNHYSPYLWFKDHSQGQMIQQIELLYTENLTATAYMARIVSILAGLHKVLNPT